MTTVPTTLLSLGGQAAHMRGRGLEVHALSSPEPELAEYAAFDGAEIHAVAMTRDITPIQDLVAVVRIWRELRRIRPAIVHAYTPKAGLLGTLAARLARTPVCIYHVMGLRYVTTTGFKRTILRWSEKWACRLADEVLCVSASLREEIIEAGLCPAPKVRVLLGGSVNGVDAAGEFNPTRAPGARTATRARYDIPPDASVVGFVGRVVRDKGLIELAEAWKVLSRERTDLHLLIVGPFEAVDPVPSDIEGLLRADPRIHLTGTVDDTPPLFAAMDLLVLPSYREGLGVVLLEAAAMELPVVATRIPGCVDAVADGVTGTLVPPRDAPALTDAIRRYLDDPERRRAHGQAGRDRVLRRFGQQAIWEALYDVYARLLRERGVPIAAMVATGSGPAPAPPAP
jgi:glycosyltransferase involved in cell wall biosynthesis